MQIEISIIVPVYNVQRYISRCIESILSQTFADFELILVDDGSTDNSYQICKSYAEKDSRIRLYSKSNGGCSSARNLGLQEARGEWILFIDADDWIDEATLESYYNHSITAKADLIYSDYNLLFENNRVRSVSSIPYSLDKRILLENAIKSEWNIMGVLFVKRDVYTNNKIRFLEGIRYCEDFHCFILLFIHAKVIHYLPKSLYYYNQLNTSSIMHNFHIGYISDQLKVYELILSEIKDCGYMDFCKKSMYHRVLKSKEHYLLIPRYHDLFMKTIPESHDYIWSCTDINLKRRVLMWLLTHRGRKLLIFLLFLKSKLVCSN